MTPPSDWYVGPPQSVEEVIVPLHDARLELIVLDLWPIGLPVDHRIRILRRALLEFGTPP